MNVTPSGAAPDSGVAVNDADGAGGGGGGGGGGEGGLTPQPAAGCITIEASEGVASRVPSLAIERSRTVEDGSQRAGTVNTAGLEAVAPQAAPFSEYSALTAFVIV